MKTTIAVLLLGALTTVAYAQRRGGFDITAMLEKYACRVVYNSQSNRPNIEKRCENPDFPSLDRLLECTPINFGEFSPIMRMFLGMFLGNIEELSLCLPKTCNSDSTCRNIDQNSICTTPENFKPSEEQMQSIQDRCRLDHQGPDGQRRGGQSGGNRGFGSFGGGGFDPSDFMPAGFAEQTRCSIPPAVFTAMKACRRSINGGSPVTKPCRRPQSGFGGFPGFPSFRTSGSTPEKTCDENTIDCRLRIGRDNVDLTFCRAATNDFAESGQP